MIIELGLNLTQDLGSLTTQVYLTNCHPATRDGCQAEVVTSLSGVAVNKLSETRHSNTSDLIVFKTYLSFVLYSHCLQDSHSTS